MDCRESGRRGTWAGTQFKAEADRIAHVELSRRLREIDESLPVVSEEDEDPAIAQAERFWLIDPLDGTASYAEGFAGFVCQAAVIESGRPVLSAVYAPASNEMFTASLGQGAYRNGERLVLNDRPLARLIDNSPEPRGIALALYRDFALIDYVESGSIGLKICRVADGTADLFIKDVTVRDWDLAPADLVLSEAGGSATTVDGVPFRYRGSSSHHGIIAATSRNKLQRVVEWYSTRSVTETSL
jgi:3'-phosphoadenosine 5'-phosphosulfate (PAPS) 3'-phosphatase